MMKSSNSKTSGIKEFGDGNVALFNVTGGGQDSKCDEIEEQEDFEAEFFRILTDEINTNNLELPPPSDTILLEDTFKFESNSIDVLTPKSVSNEVKFEEDPLSTVLNKEHQNTVKKDTPRKRGRPAIIKFKTVTPLNNNNHILTVKHQNPLDREHCHLQMRDRRSDSDFYSPVWIRGRGVEREGLCPLCEPVVWLKIKQSAYWYHMNFFHGISAATGKPYKRPISYRYTPEFDSSFKVDGHCGNCLQWISLVTDYNGDKTTESVERSVCFTSWYKHAQKCHYRTKEFHIPDNF